MLATGPACASTCRQKLMLSGPATLATVPHQISISTVPARLPDRHSSSSHVNNSLGRRARQTLLANEVMKRINRLDCPTSRASWTKHRIGNRAWLLGLLILSLGSAPGCQSGPWNLPRPELKMPELKMPQMAFLNSKKKTERIDDHPASHLTPPSQLAEPHAPKSNGGNSQMLAGEPKLPTSSSPERSSASGMNSSNPLPREPYSLPGLSDTDSPAIAQGNSPTANDPTSSSRPISNLYQPLGSSPNNFGSSNSDNSTPAYPDNSNLASNSSSQVDGGRFGNDLPGGTPSQTFTPASPSTINNQFVGQSNTPSAGTENRTPDSPAAEPFRFSPPDSGQLAQQGYPDTGMGQFQLSPEPGLPPSNTSPTPGGNSFTPSLAGQANGTNPTPGNSLTPGTSLAGQTPMPNPSNPSGTPTFPAGGPTASSSFQPYPNALAGDVPAARVASNPSIPPTPTNNFRRTALDEEPGSLSPSVTNIPDQWLQGESDYAPGSVRRPAPPLSQPPTSLPNAGLSNAGLPTQTPPAGGPQFNSPQGLAPTGMPPAHSSFDPGTGTPANNSLPTNNLLPSIPNDASPPTAPPTTSPTAPAAGTIQLPDPPSGGGAFVPGK